MGKRTEKNWLSLFDKLANPTNTLKDTLVGTLIYESKIVPNLNMANPLTPQEIICLTLLARGLSPEKCADILNIEKSSVRTYEQRMREKLGATHRLNVFYKALEGDYILFRK